jgi:iron complex outermembrane receptor protein
MNNIKQKDSSVSMIIKRNFLVVTPVAVAVAACFASTDIQAQQEAGAVLEEIVVTGSRRKGRTVSESNVPVDVFQASDLASSGSADLSQLLASNLPSFNFPNPSITDGTDHVRPAVLRGLSPDHTLVLINGKRRHTSAILNVNGSIGRGSSPVDLSRIPSSAIKNIEVLRDGAAAQYGSDAIAGVINIALKDNKDGGSFNVNFGQHDTNVDGVKQLQSVSVGADGNLAFTEGGDRSLSDGESITVAANYGFGLGDTGFLNISAELQDVDATNRSAYDRRENYARIDGSLDPRELTIDRYNHRFGQNESESKAVFYNLGYTIRDDLELYSFGSWANRESESGGFYRRAQDSRNLPAIYPDGFLPLIATDIDDTSFAVGIRGTRGEWGWDASVNYGKNELQFNVNNSLNVSLGNSSPTSFDAGTLSFDQVTLNVDISRELEIAAKPSSIAFGAEYRRDGYEIEPGQLESFQLVAGALNQNGGLAQAGSQVFPGFSPRNQTNVDRDNISLYGEIDIDLSERFNVTAAGRFEDYSDFGSTFNAKLASRFQVAERVALRGALSTGFRAPSLNQSFYTSVSTIFVNSVPNDVLHAQVSSPEARALGAQDLEPEESTNLSLGLVMNPTDNWSLTVDLYQIDIDDRIALSGNISGQGAVDVLNAAGLTGVSRVRYTTNAIDTRTQGIDIVSTHSVDIGRYGALKLTAAFNSGDTQVTRLAPEPAVLQQLGVTRFDRRDQLRFEESAPETKTNLSATWLTEKVTSTLRVARYGEFTQPGTASDDSDDGVYGSATLVDLDVSVNVTDAINLSIGANNLFDEYPDLSSDARNGGPGGTFNRIFAFSGFSPYSFNGRYWYARLGYEF